MSRVGKKPILIPSGVEVAVEGARVVTKGPQGTLAQEFDAAIMIQVSDGHVTVNRPSDERQHRALHGLTRTLVANMVTGVSQGFQKSLELVGVGYRAQQTGKGITLNVGYSHTVEFAPLGETSLEVEGNNRIHVRGANKQEVGELAARIRKVRPPNVYTGKGIRYAGEFVKLKPGKSAGRA